MMYGEAVMNIQQVQSLIAEAMEKHNGIVKKEELTKLGIDYRRIDALVKEGKLSRVRNGYYTDRVDGFGEVELVAALFPDAMLCMESALYAYGYLKEKPYGWTLAVDKNTSKSRFKMDYPRIIPFYTEPEALSLGASVIELQGCSFGIYDKERLICDCLKYESMMISRLRFRHISQILIRISLYLWIMRGRERS